MTTITVTKEQYEHYKEIMSATAEHHIKVMLDYAWNRWGHLYHSKYIDETGYPRCKIMVSFPKRHRYGGRGGNTYNKGKWMGWIRLYMTSKLNQMITEIHGYSTGADAWEYEFIEDDPVIGKLYDVKWTKQLVHLVAHEVAHVVDYMVTGGGHDETKARREKIIESSIRSEFTLSGKPDKGHGRSWMSIYATLREEFVNHIADEDITVITPEKKKTRKSKWDITRDGNFAKYIRIADDGLRVHAGYIWTSEFKYGSGLNYEVLGRDRQTIGWCKSIGEARKLLEENVFLFVTTGKEIERCEQKLRFAA
jgi:hypothetical protein